jgi:tetratricopeptide (TPR) repeat protein
MRNVIHAIIMLQPFINNSEMKKLLTAVSLTTWVMVGFSQDYKNVDSLKQVLASIQSDTGKIWAMHDVAFNYIYSRPDSTTWFAQQALALSEKINYERGEIRSHNDIGSALASTGSYSEAIEIFLEALHKSEELNDKTMEAITLGNLAETYSLQGDERQAINLSLRSLAIDPPDLPILNLVHYLNLGNYYEKAGQLDSALLYENHAYELALQKNAREQIGDILYSLGSIQSKLGNDDLALPYYRKAEIQNRLVGNDIYLSLSYYGLATVFKRAGAIDSTRFYLGKSYETSMGISDRKGMLDAATQLSSLYEPLNNDSALKYLKLSVALKDSIFKQEKVKQVQSLTIDEQLREAAIAEAKHKEKTERRHNLQLMGIAAFISLFFGVILLLSRKKSKPRSIEFMGLLGLLLLFEFISLLIHPYIAEHTNHSPIYMLLILVAIAALLVPTHHKLQKFVINKLARKPRKPVVSAEEVPQVQKP